MCTEQIIEPIIIIIKKNRHHDKEFCLYVNVHLIFITSVSSILKAINANGRDLTVDFPQQSHWTGVIDEMEIVPSSHPGIG